MDVLTASRTLDGISYELMVDTHDISRFVNTEIRKEWEDDIRGRGDDPLGSGWLTGLAAREWKLEIVGLDEIQLNQSIMNYVDAKTGYNFIRRLEERKRELKRALENGSQIWPLVLRGEDSQLMDGYCRYHTLREMGANRAYVYIGT